MTTRKRATEPVLTAYREMRARHAQRIADIVLAVSQASNVDVPTLYSRYIYQEYVEARWAAIRIARSEGISIPMIGRGIGRRDHTTVINALARSQWMIDHDPVRGPRLQAIEARTREILASGSLISVHEALAAIRPFVPKRAAATSEPPAVPQRPLRQHGTVDRYGNIICNP